MKSLEELRARLDVIDRELLQLVAERQTLGKQIAEVKRSAGQPTRDFRREREVLLKARRDADALGVSPALAESLLQSLIRGSLTTQEQARVAAQGRGSGRSALVIGGRGKMGHWMADFLAAQGFAVSVADPSGEVAGYDYVADWKTADLHHDIIVVATPIRIANEVLAELAGRRPRGIVFDIGSLKTPLRAGLEQLRAAGCHVTSVHPMFGPDTELLSGRHVIFIDLGDAVALAEARALFGSTMADLVVMGLDEHDRLIAFVLGLSHALNIAFFTALAESGEAAPRLARMSSTTFDAQLDVATRVAAENPDLYFEIQSLNDYGVESLNALQVCRRSPVPLGPRGRCGSLRRHDAAGQRIPSRAAGRARRGESLSDERPRHPSAAGAGLVKQPDGRALARPARGQAGAAARSGRRIADWRAAAARSSTRTPPPGRRRGNQPDSRPGLRFVDSLAGVAPGYGTLHAPWSGPYHPADHGLLIAAEAGCTHLAMLPLPRSGGLTGRLQRRQPRRTRCARSARARLARSHRCAGAGQRRAAVATRAPAARRRRGSAHGLEQPALLSVAPAGAGGGQRARLGAGHLHGDRCRRPRQPQRKARSRGGRRRPVRGGQPHRRAGASERFLRARRRRRICRVAAATPPQVATRLAERILAAVRAAPIATAPGMRDVVRVSIGIAGLDPATLVAGMDRKATADEWLSRAHAALHQAKRDGGDRYVAS